MNENGEMGFSDTVTLAVPEAIRVLAFCYAGIVFVAILLVTEVTEETTV